MRTWGLGAAALLVAGTAQAESVKMTGRFPAPERDVAMLGSIAVERFAGRDGPALAIALERALAESNHFAVVAGGHRGGGADGTISGAVSSGVQETPFTKTEKRCVERDANDKCLREAEVKIACTRRIVEFGADIRVVDLADNRILYSRETPRRDELTWCEGKQPSRTVETTVRGMIAGVADEIAGRFVPRVETYSIRFRESTKGMPKDVEKAFKAVVKQSQRDLQGACRAWQDLDARVPDHGSIVFDLGLCAEAAGDWSRAADLYRRATLLDPRGDEAAQGADRIANLIAARADDAERSGRRQ